MNKRSDARIAQRIRVVNARIKISEIKHLLRYVHDVDPLQIGEGSADNLAHALAVRDVEDRDPKTLAILAREVLESLGLADCGGYRVTTMKQQRQRTESGVQQLTAQYAAGEAQTTSSAPMVEAVARIAAIRPLGRQADLDIHSGRQVVESL